jgi:PAS domain S-box-containing protein
MTSSTSEFLSEDNFSITEILDSNLTHELTRICQLASLFTDTQGAYLALEDGEEIKIISKFGISDENFEQAPSSLKELLNKTTFSILSDPIQLSKTSDEVTIAIIPIQLNPGKAIGLLALVHNKAKEFSQKVINGLQLLKEEAEEIIIKRIQDSKKENFETLFNLSKDLVCIVNRQGQFEKVNPYFHSLLRYKKEEVLDQPFANFIHPEDLEYTFEIFQKLLTDSKTISFDHRFLSKEGLSKTIQWTATPEPNTGKIFAIGRDISEAKEIESQLVEKEARLKVFFENSQGLMCTHDLEGNFLSVNFAGASILGYTVEEVIQFSLFDLVPEENHPGVENYLKLIKSEGKANGQMAIRHKNGSIRTWIFNNVMYHPENGDTEYIIGNAIDISNRAVLEKDLKETKILLEETGQVARVGGWTLDLIHQKLSWTPVTKLIHEVPDDFVPDLESGINFYKEGESREKISQAVDEAINEGKSWNLDLQIITFRGNMLWVRAIGKPIMEEGKCVRVVGTFQDIDETKKAELEAASAKKLLDDVFSASSEVSVIATDLTGVITVFNRGAEKMLGYLAEEMIGKQTPEIIHLKQEVIAHSEVVSEEFGKPVEGFQTFVARAERDGAEQRDWTYIRKDGKKRLVSLVVTPIKDTENTSIGYLGIAIDITDKVETEIELSNEKGRLSAFVKHAPAAVAMLDKDLKYIAVSNRWLEEYQLKDQDVLGISHFEIFDAVINDEVKDLFYSVLKGNVESKQEDIFKLPGSDEEIYVSWEMRPWYLHDGKIGGMMIYTQNITGMVKRREELKNAKLVAEEASRAKSEFLANMSHEIRTPLNGVIGFTDLVLKTKLNETQLQYLTIVNQSANALLSIINDILDFSKIEAGKLELDIDKSDLFEMASQATDIITYQIQNKGLEMLLNVDPSLPRFIHADSVRLKQVLVNLLGNASKFTEEGEIELKIENLKEVDGKNLLRFSVRDTGIGISLEKQEKIFEAFSQEDSSTTKKYGGTGLGLTISNKLLGLMGSKLQLISSPGKGSTFYFDVVMETEAGDPIEWSGMEEIKEVLVVDDNDNNRLIVNQMLLLKNIKTTEAKNGFEALQILSKGKQFDVILMDYHMPFMDGIETIKKIRESFTDHLEDMPILLLHSSSDDQRIIQACKDLNIKFRMIKPLKLQEFYHVLSHLKEEVDENQIEVEAIPFNDKSLKVLIAEDNPVNMLLAETIFRKIGPNITLIKAMNGKEALEQCEGSIPDLIFMDIQMPEMNGYVATEKIRSLSNGQNVPIIALTAGNVKGEKEKCLAVGMNDFVVKPIVEDILREVLEKWATFNVDSNSDTNSLEETDHYDPEVLKLYTDYNSEVWEGIIEIVKSELSRSKLSLRKEIEAKNLPGIKEAGHKLYGTAVSSGMNQLAKMSEEFELTKEINQESLIKQLEKIEKEIELILELLKK